ncbi:MAG: TldD/PmbA family protein [Xenococcaceae cyanobacterium MO_188.B19]|nr:TldD/PmbA family protein [Xenococcaceae cyanobacterium MO_188.B19]
MSQPEALLALAKQKGIEDAEVYQVKSQSRPVFFEGNRLKQLESFQSEGTALRIWRNGCPGLAVAYGQVEAQTLIDKAITLSEINPPETIELTEGEASGKGNKNIYPPIGEILPVEYLIDIGQNAIAKIRDFYPETVCSAELECETETTTLVNTKGLSCQYTETSFSYSLGVELVRGEDFLGIYDGEYSIETPESNLDSPEIRCEHLVDGIVKRLEWAHNNATPLTGKVPVLFTANAASLLWDVVCMALNSKRVVEGSSPWSDSIGKLVVSPSLTIQQQPNLLPYRCPFDDEGTPTQTLKLITAGRLEQFYCDRVVGRQLGLKTTGNGFRPDLGSYPTPGLVNCTIQPGAGSVFDLIKQLDQGIVVDQILGGGADISGDFSINVDLGYRVENGKIVGRVKDTAIAGNVYTILKEIVALGDDLIWSGSYYTPCVIVEGLSVIA